jgi:hypothetical protein
LPDSTTHAGTTVQTTCGKTVPLGIGAVVLCTHKVDKGRLVKVVGGSGDCTNPTPAPEATSKDDEVDIEKLIRDPAKLREHVRQQLPPSAQKLFEQINKP